MLGTAKKVLVAGAALAISTMAASADAVTVKFDQPNMGFGKGPIVVESTDGKSWSKINSTTLELPISIFIGHNSNDFEMNFYSIHQDGKMIYHYVVPNWYLNNPYMKTTKVDVSTDNFNSITKMNLMSACNSRLTKPGAIHEDQKMFFKVPLMLYAKFFRDNGTWFAKQGFGHSMVPVVCKGFPKRVPPKPVNISSVKFEAFATKTSTSKPNSCPKQRVARVRIEGDKKTTVTGVLVRGDGKTTEHKIPVLKPNTGYTYFVLDSKLVKQSETEKYYFIIKGHKYSSGWKTVEIKCPKGVDKGPDTLADKPKPNQDAPKPQSKPQPTPGGVKLPPKRPAIVIDPVRPLRPVVRPGFNIATPGIKCIGGKIAANKCYCPAGKKRIKIAKRTYRCIGQPTHKRPNVYQPQHKQPVAGVQQQNQKQPLRKLFRKIR